MGNKETDHKEGVLEPLDDVQDDLDVPVQVSKAVAKEEKAGRKTTHDRAGFKDVY